MRHPLNTPIGRFGIETDERGTDRCVASMPLHGLCNPITGQPSLGPLALLVDHVGGLINHHRRPEGQWAVSSELALEVAPACATIVAAHPDTPVVATATPFGGLTTTGLGVCALTVDGELVGEGTVRSFFISAPEHLAHWPTDDGGETAKTGLAAMLAVGLGRREGPDHVLPQHPDPVLNNSMHVVHGGIAATGLEVVGSAAVDGLVTASLRVNFLRQFIAGDQSRYVATALRVGRSSGVADSQAIGSDGRVAVVARLTAYRC